MELILRFKIMNKTYKKNKISKGMCRLTLAAALFSSASASAWAQEGVLKGRVVDAEGNPTAEAPYNPNGSSYAIEGILSPDGRILGKMGHTERYERNLFKNIAGYKEQSLFRIAVDYFRKK